MKLSFYKDNLGDWYVNLPDYPGNKEDLQMVCGADVMLDIFAQGDESVKLKISIDNFDTSTHRLDAIEEESGGMSYMLVGKNELFDVWLCDVTKYIFGEFPNNLYIQKI